jgi:hypothetical protein
METKPKIRLGNGKKRSASWLTAAICISDAEAHAYTYEGKKYVNISINVFDEPNKYGKDVAITLNDYKKEDNLTPEVNKIPTAPAPVMEESYDLPF